MKLRTPTTTVPLWLLATFAFGGNNACSCEDDGEKAVVAGPDGGAIDGGAATGMPCVEDRVVCNGTVARVCDGRGGFKTERDCADEGQTCLSSRLSSTGEVLALGCVACTPGEASCSEDVGRVCREDGSGFDVFDCDPVQGMVCEPGGCRGVCAPPEVTRSYIGCDYYPTVTLNPVWSGFDFAVAVANASDTTASVLVTRGSDTVAELDVAVDALEVVVLPWVETLKGGDQDACQVPPEPGDSRVVVQGAYRLRSDQPVTVYQLSPLQYQREEDGGGAPAGCPVGTDCPGGIVAECLSYSNDASLLLPATTLTGDYTVMSWPSRGNTASFFAITATADDTRVAITADGTLRPGGGVGRDGTNEVVLDRGDVLQVLASHGDDTEDASGARVRADKPVQVIGGQSCANVPDPQVVACDHLEQALFPLQILGDDYIVPFPAAVASESPHVLRIAAIEPDTRVELDPPVAGPFSLDPGDPPVEVRIGTYDRSTDTGEDPVDVRITATAPVLVAQYMQGQQAVPSGAGDPSMSLAVPLAQYRDQYIFTASDTYDANFISVVAPIGTSIVLDGQALAGDSRDVGDSDFEVTRARLPDDGPVVHRIEGDAPFGLTVYGYGRFTSYMYPGGLDLRRITTIRPE